MINIPHIDEHIWDPATCAIDIIGQLTMYGNVTINMDDEGADLTALGLYAILDKICKELNFNKKSINIITRNQLESHAEYKITKLPPLYFIEGQQFIKDNPAKDKQFKNHYGIFIGRSSWQRLLLSSYLYKHHKDKLNITYHYDRQVDYHRAHLGVNELTLRMGIPDTFELTSHLLRNTPIKNENLSAQPVPTPEQYYISKIYHEFFVEIVCETFCAGSAFYPTEKIWRPIMNLTPFMVQGPIGFLGNLKQLGFETFDKYWDESYDIDGNLGGIKTIQRNIDMLSTKSVDEIARMYTDMRPILEHNQQVFLELTNSKFKNIWN